MFAPVMTVVLQLHTTTSNLLIIPLTNFVMKRGAETQLTKAEFEDGNVEPEARLVDPVDTTRFHSFSV